MQVCIRQVGGGIGEWVGGRGSCPGLIMVGMGGRGRVVKEEQEATSHAGTRQWGVITVHSVHFFRVEFGRDFDFLTAYLLTCSDGKFLVSD
jgi:hypothetical protein